MLIYQSVTKCNRLRFCGSGACTNAQSSGGEPAGGNLDQRGTPSGNAAAILKSD
jgi:hypothetical protein